MNNQLYFGDNLQVLRERIADASVDLIYLDPPFNSKRDYNLTTTCRSRRRIGQGRQDRRGIGCLATEEPQADYGFGEALMTTYRAALKDALL